MDIFQLLKLNKTVDQKELQRKYSRTLDSYELVAKFSEDLESREIAQKKIALLKEHGAASNLKNEIVETESVVSEQNEITQIKLMMNTSNGSPTTLQSDKVLGRVKRLSDSGEKHYLLAILTLALNNKLQGCKEAISELQIALAFDPQNQAYMALVDAISFELSEFERVSGKAMEEAEAKRIQQENASLTQLQNTQRGNFFSSGRGCIFFIAVIVIVIIVYTVIVNGLH